MNGANVIPWETSCHYTGTTMVYCLTVYCGKNSLFNRWWRSSALSRFSLASSLHTIFTIFDLPFITCSCKCQPGSNGFLNRETSLATLPCQLNSTNCWHPVQALIFSSMFWKHTKWLLQQLTAFLRMNWPYL